jgi:transposase
MERFEEYVEHKLVPVLGKLYMNEQRSIVVMDNSLIHISKKVVEMIHDAGAQIVFTTPYSPDLNPIEFMFSFIRQG